MKKCDHIKTQMDSQYAYCHINQIFGMYAFVEKDCHKECYINKQEERKLKLNKLYEKKVIIYFVSRIIMMVEKLINFLFLKNQYSKKEIDIKLRL